MEPQNLNQQPQIITPPATSMQPQPPAQDPGKTLGIIGLILAFIGMHLIGLILSIIGRKKSKNAGFNNPVALWGIILNSIFMVITIILTTLFIVFLAIPGIQKAQEATSKCEELGVGTHQSVTVDDTSGTLTCTSDGGVRFSSPSYNFESSL